MEDEDRRKENRISKRNTFQFKIHHTDRRDPLIKEGLLLDYSAAGIRFMTDMKLDKNLALFIQLNLEDFRDADMDWREMWEIGSEAYLNVIGSVMWCMASGLEEGKFEVGTRFTQKASEKSII